MKNSANKARTNKSDRKRLLVDGAAADLDAGRIAISIGGWTFGQVDCEGGTAWGASDGHTTYVL